MSRTFHHTDKRRAPKVRKRRQPKRATTRQAFVAAALAERI